MSTRVKVHFLGGGGSLRQLSTLLMPYNASAMQEGNAQGNFLGCKKRREQNVPYTIYGAFLLSHSAGAHKAA